jgi:microcystin-dependent protein
MAEPFVGQLSLVGFNFPPIGWALAQGQLLPITQNAALFSLLGTTYGGNGTSNFALPNLQGRVALGFGQAPGLSLYDLGEQGGEQTVTLLTSQTPPHTHTAQCAAAGAAQANPVGNSFAEKSDAGNIYGSPSTPPATMSASAVSVAGGNLPHNNLMPYLTLNWIVALQGIFPARG